MSAFQVSNETINRVLHLLDLDHCGCVRTLGHSLDYDAKGQALWQLNSDAVNYRYRQSKEPLFEQFKWSPRNYSLFEMLKAGECWRYQCSEGEQFESHNLYSEVSESIRSLRSLIVSRLPEYDAVPWDAPHNQKLVGVPKAQGVQQ